MSCKTTDEETVHSPLFFRKIVEIERFALRAAILHECQNYLGGGGDARPRGTFENQDGRHQRVRCAISRRPHEKIEDCEQSNT